MNTKKFFGLFTALVAVVLLFTACPPKPPVVDGSSIRLYGNTKTTTAEGLDAIGISDGSDYDYKAASLLSGAELTDNGTEIIGIRFYVRDGAKSGKIFIGPDYENPVVEKEYTYKKGGWQYVLFDEPYAVTGEDIYIGYSIKGSGYLLGYETSSRNMPGEMLYFNGAWGTFKTVVGSNGKWTMQAIMRGGDYSTDIQNNLVVECVENLYTAALEGWDMPLTFEVRNSGAKTAYNVAVKCTFGSQSKDVTIDSLMNGQSYFVESPFTVSGSGSVSVSIDASVDGVTDETPNDNSVKSSCTVTGSDNVRNRVLIEQFTGQACGYCPGGAANLKSAIEATGHPEYFAWVAHHAGYYPDDFTLQESKDIAAAFGVNSAPMMCINRTSVAGQGLVWSPYSATAVNLLGCYATPAKATLEFNHTLVGDSITVNVSGTTAESAAKVSVILIQSGITASQSSGGNNYVHNNAPCLFLTPAKGQDLTIGEGGAFSATFSGIIPATFGEGNFNTVYSDIEVVVFVHGDIKSSANRNVFNADRKPLLEGNEVFKPANILPVIEGISTSNVIAD
ncbi:MAG: Omp28-related outer membrane protein [Paludibacteraceae bacterium]|nr:Omp28-related outer membrane protein [Paludibacteraceae bacterium]